MYASSPRTYHTISRRESRGGVCHRMDRAVLRGHGLAGQTRAVTRRVLAALVLLVSALAVGCGGQEPKGQRGPAAKTPRVAPVTEGPGRLVEIGGGRSLYLECVGSGSPTVVLEAGFGADTFSWRDV